MKISRIFTLFFILNQVIVHAQNIERQLLSTSGGELSKSNISLSISIGEMAVTTMASDLFRCNQGFQQGDELVIIDATSTFIELKAQAYPNPTKEDISIYFFGQKPKTPLNISIFDNRGRLVHKKTDTFNQQVIQLSLKEYPVGAYFIQIENTYQERGLMKVVKTN